MKGFMSYTHDHFHECNQSPSKVIVKVIFDPSPEIRLLPLVIGKCKPNHESPTWRFKEKVAKHVNHRHGVIVPFHDCPINVEPTIWNAESKSCSKKYLQVELKGHYVFCFENEKDFTY